MNESGSIAFVCPRYSSPKAVGGAETLLKRLAEKAAARGRKVDFLTTCAQDHYTWANTLAPGRRTMNGVCVHFFPVDEKRDPAVFMELQRRISRGLRLSDEEEEAWMAHGVQAPALYEHLKEHGGAYERILTGPYLFGLTLHTVRLCPRQTLLVPCLHDEPFAYTRVVGELFGRARGCLFNSEPEKNLGMRLYGLPERKCAVVGMGLDSYEADAKAFPERHGLRAPYLLYCGRREPLKGTPLLMDYVQTFRERTGRDIRLVLTGVGEAPAPPGFEDGLYDAGCLGELEKREAMAGALAFCHPSVHESFGIVLLESWLAGVPALVHADSAVLRYHCRRAGGGLWFRRYPEFEEELLLLLDRPALRGRLGQAGKAYVEKTYSWQAVGGRLFEALEKL